VAGGQQQSFSDDGAAAELLRLWLRSRVEEGEREARATERVERPGGSGRRPDQVKPVGHGASTTPAYGRHVAGAEWSEAGAARGREGRGRQAGLLSGPKERRGWPSSACPLFHFFLNFFSQILF